MATASSSWARSCTWKVGDKAIPGGGSAPTSSAALAPVGGGEASGWLCTLAPHLPSVREAVQAQGLPWWSRVLLAAHPLQRQQGCPEDTGVPGTELGIRLVSESLTSPRPRAGAALWTALLPSPVARKTQAQAEAQCWRSVGAGVGLPKGLGAASGHAWMGALCSCLHEPWLPGASTLDGKGTPCRLSGGYCLPGGSLGVRDAWLCVLSGRLTLCGPPTTCSRRDTA